ncbi:hypothetical protein [Gordonia sp. NPDC003376]
MTYSSGEGLTPPEWSPVPETPAPGSAVAGPAVPGPQWGTGIGAPPPPPAWQQPTPAHRPGILPLRPLGVGDIIAATFATLTRSPRQHFAIGAAATAIMLAVTMPAVALAVAVTDGEITVESWLAALAGTLDNHDLIALVIIGPVALVVFADAAGLWASWPQLIGTLRRRFTAIVGTTVPLLLLGLSPVLVGTVVVDRLPDTPGGLAAIIVLSAVTLVGVVVGLVRLGQAPAVAATESLRPGAALRRAVALSGTGFWRYLAVFVLLAMICGAISWVLQVGVFAVGEVWEIPPVVDSALTGVCAVLDSVLLTPLVAGAFAVMGIDARIRREGFQVQLADWAAGSTR